MGRGTTVICEGGSLKNERRCHMCQAGSCLVCGLPAEERAAVLESPVAFAQLARRLAAFSGRVFELPVDYSKSPDQLVKASGCKVYAHSSDYREYIELEPLLRSGEAPRAEWGIRKLGWKLINSRKALPYPRCRPELEAYCGQNGFRLPNLEEALTCLTSQGAFWCIPAVLAEGGILQVGYMNHYLGHVSAKIVLNKDRWATGDKSWRSIDDPEAGFNTLVVSG